MLPDLGRSPVAAFDVEVRCVRVCRGIRRGYGPTRASPLLPVPDHELQIFAARGHQKVIKALTSVKACGHPVDRTAASVNRPETRAASDAATVETTQRVSTRVQ